MRSSEEFGRWLERKSKAVLAWRERLDRARCEAALRNHNSVDICIALCVAPLLGFLSHPNALHFHSVLGLAAIVAFLNFLQLTLIAGHHEQGAGK